MENKNQVVDKKKASWNYINGCAIVTFPDGTTKSFDTKAIDSECLKYYGIKQILSDIVAGFEGTFKEKAQAMMDWFLEAKEKGLEITETGKLSIRGKVRKNASPKNADGIINSVFDTISVEEAKATLTAVRLGVTKLSADVIAKLEAKVKS